MSHLPFMTIPTEDGTSEVIAVPAEDLVSSSKSSSAAAMPSKTITASILGYLRFPAAIIITLITSAGLHSAAAEFTGSELSTISRSLNEPWQIGALLAWRVVELYLGWQAGFDYWDAAASTLLAVTPYHVLIALFYGILPVSVLIALSIDLLSVTLPYVLLRRLAVYNNPPQSAPIATQLSTSGTLKLYITTFLTVLYAVTIYVSIQTFLPAYLVGNFDVRTLEPAYAATLPLLLTAAIPLGNAAKDFLYVPSTYLAKAGGDEIEFNPETATLAETFAWNVGLSGWGKREDTLVQRTTLLVILTLGSSVAKIYGTVQGAELAGALGWGGVFAAAAILAGAGVGYVGDV